MRHCRFRKRIKFGPFALNLSKNGLSSISLGGPGASLNIPVARSGGVRQTVGIPGTGLSWSEQAPSRSTRERRQAQRQQLPTTQQIINDLLDGVVGPDKIGDSLWRQGLVQRVLDCPDTPRRVREAALLIRSPEMVELHCRRARGAAATNRAALDVIEAIRTVLAFTEEMGWSTPAEED